MMYLLPRWLLGLLNGTVRPSLSLKAFRPLGRRSRRRSDWGFAAVSGLTRIESLEERCLLTALVSGVTVVGEIAVPGEVDEFTFTVNDGDSVLLNFARTGGDFNPELTLTAPDASVVFTSAATEHSLTLENLAAGTYTLAVRDEVNPGSTGDYALTFVRLPGVHQLPASEGPLISGATITNEITAADIDVYTFTAGAGDTALINLARTSGDFNPFVQVFDGAGNEVFSGVAPAHSFTLEDLSPGTYTITVRDDAAATGTTGEYALTFVKIPGVHQLPAGEGPLISGQTRTGEIELGDIDVHTFAANAGDSAVLNVARTSGDFNAWVQIFGPGGNVVYSATGNEHSRTLENLAAGVYTIAIRDRADIGGDTGEYALTFVKVPGTHVLPDGEGPLTGGVAKTGAITLADVDVYTFNANAGDQVHLNVVRTSGNFQPWVQVFSPNGNIVYSSTNALQNQQLTLQSAGLYTITIRDTSALPGATGEYSLTVSGFTSNGPGAPPVIDNFGPNLVYPPGGDPILIAADVTVSDPDSTHFHGGKLWVTLPNSQQPGDRLGIRNEGTDPGQIGLSQGQVTYGGVVIGQLDPSALVVTFNANATVAAVQALLRNLVFWNTNEAPNAATRTVRVQLSDGSTDIRTTVTKSINVFLSQNPPVIGNFGPALTYFIGSPAVIVDGDVTVTDVDSPNFAGGQLWVTLADSAQPGDRLGIRNQGTGAGQIGFADGQVTYGGVVIGVVNGPALAVTFNSSATPTAVQALLRNIVFWNNLQQPSLALRTVRVQLSDGSSPVRTTATKTIHVAVPNNPPVIGNFGPDVNYARRSPPVLIDADVTVADPDSPNFDGGQLWVTLAGTGQPQDRLSIRHQGNGAGQIGFVNGQVFYGGVLIGTQQGAALVILFNANATPQAVQALLRNLNFVNTNFNAPLGTRTVRVQLTDGDSNVRTTVEKQIHVV